ncbi:hypothetical protein MPSEU_001079400 [Mayamaea pseudoterrestris]|nr:hypothetical protein MPSEU_001079400 [Mayamaea pseudoterrestris]
MSHSNLIDADPKILRPPLSLISIDDEAQPSSLLQKQWPRGGSIQDYFDKITSSSKHLPCSYILLYEDAPVGHVRITECLDDSSARAVAATYIITEPRNQGYGRILMKLLEKRVKQLNYHYIYVWTHTAVDFYTKCGYKPTHRVSLHRPCLKRLECSQVSRIESLLASRMAVMQHGSSSCDESTKRQAATAETVLLPPDEMVDGGASVIEDVWLRKRLVECLPLTIVSLKHRLQELQACTIKYPEYASWKYYIRHDVPWTQQVGPSCGLAALRMVHGAAQPTTAVATTDDSLPSLLEYAIQQHYSDDGELFDAMHLLRLGQDVCNLSCRTESLRATPARKILSHLMQRRLLVFAYDSQPATRQPCCNDGKSAHYGVMVGMLVGRKVDDGLNAETLRSPTPIDELSQADLISLENDPLSSECVMLALVQHGLSNKLTIAT